MNYDLPSDDSDVDQGDIIDDCPLLSLGPSDINQVLTNREPQTVNCTYSRVVIMTQTCDLAQKKSSVVLVAVVRNAAEMV